MNENDVNALTVEDIEHYDQHGWLITPPILDCELLDNAKHAALGLYEGEVDNMLPIEGGYLNWRREQGEGLRINDYASLQLDAIEDLILSPAIGAYAASLMKSDVARLFHDQLIAKPTAEPAIVGWHIDQAYWRNCTKNNLITAWIPFDDTTIESGPLTFIDKSHHWSGTDQLNTFTHENSDTLFKSEGFSGRNINKIPVTVAKGQFSFHHPKTVHGSGSNVSDQLRLALAVHIQPGNNRYNERVPEVERKLHINDLMCRKNKEGYPDYTDSEIFPIMWGNES